MQKVSGQDVCNTTLTRLGLDPLLIDIESDEFISTYIRRVAGNICPASKSKIERTVIDSLKYLFKDINLLIELVENIMNELIAYGDFIQSEDIIGLESDFQTSLIYIAPPSFIDWGDKKYMLIGVIPDRNYLSGSDLESRIEYDKYTRWLYEVDNENIKQNLESLGLIEIASDNWLKSPKVEEPSVFIERIDEKLNKTSYPGELDNLRILETEKPVEYYTGRWIEVKKQTGKYICRWSKQYGSDRWGYIELLNGESPRLLVLPTDNLKYRGCDEAWRIQSAIDYLNKKPQIYKTRMPINNENNIIDVFSPLPLWIIRRWDIFGNKVQNNKNSLISYRITRNYKTEIEFLESMFWLKQVSY